MSTAVAVGRLTYKEHRAFHRQRTKFLLYINETATSK